MNNKINNPSRSSTRAGNIPDDDYDDEHEHELATVGPYEARDNEARAN